MQRERAQGHGTHASACPATSIPSPPLAAGPPTHTCSYNLAIVCPDTSPRGVNIPGEDDAYDLGTGAGFYVDATEEPWSAHYRMATYITDELAPLLKTSFPLSGRLGLAGHSMGGHGALTLYLKRPDLFSSCSAFAPICNPMECPWGQKAFKAYLGSVDAGAAYDACKLVAAFSGSVRVPILIDQGLSDKFLEDQLHPEALRAACAAVGFPLMLRLHEGYDHGYFFISTFIDDHLKHHSLYLNTAGGK